MDKLDSTQAQNIFAKFGGARRLHAALTAIGHEIAVTTVYRWSYTRTRGGTGGIIPITELAAIKKAADKAKIKIPSTLLVAVIPGMEDDKRKKILS